MATIDLFGVNCRQFYRYNNVDLSKGLEGIDTF